MVLSQDLPGDQETGGNWYVSLRSPTPRPSPLPVFGWLQYANMEGEAMGDFSLVPRRQIFRVRPAALSGLDTFTGKTGV